MPQCSTVNRSTAVASLLVLTLIVASGCQSWRSAAIPGWASKQGEAEVLRQAKHDPFPAPTDVGME